MKPKDKAIELIKKYRALEINGIYHIKKAALICVDQILSDSVGILDERTKHFWNEVKI